MCNILVISPHPDDEVIGCGGSIARHISEGDQVDVIFLTSGEKGIDGLPEAEVASIREAEAKAAADMLQIRSIAFWREPDGGFQASETNIDRLLEVLAQTPTDIVYVPHEKDAHPDHLQAALLVIQAVSRLAPAFRKPAIYMYEIWTPLQQMDIIQDITPYVSVKRAAIEAHKCQCGVMQLQEGILSLNRYRGEMHSWPGGNYAEVFMVYRFHFKQEMIIDRTNETVLIRYHPASKYLNQVASLYHLIKQIPFVPEMTFAKGLIIQQYCGESLHTLHKRNHVFTNQDKQNIRQQLIAFVGHLFKHHLAHRDFHVGNICWDGKQVWIIDWDSVCFHQPATISQHFDLTGEGLETYQQAGKVNILHESFQYPSINDIIAPYTLDLSFF